MIRQLLTMILSVNLIIAGISPGSALSKVTFSGNQTYKAEQTQSADITGDSSQDPDSGDDKAAPETETTPETGATQEDGVSQATDTPATSTDDTAIEDDGADDLDADNQNGDSSGAEESEDSEENADEFGEKAEEVDTIDSADEGFKKVKVEELIKDANKNINLKESKASDSTAVKDGSWLVDKLVFTHNGKEVKSGDKVSLSDEFYVKYNLKELTYAGSDEDGSSGELIKAGDKFELPSVPMEYFSRISNEKIKVPLGKGGSQTFGLVSFEGDKTYFTVEYEGVEGEGITNAEFGYSIKFDESKLETKSEIKIPMFGGSDLDITIAENVPSHPVIEKTGAVNGDEITWTIVVRPQKVPIENENGYTLIDTLEGEQHFKEASFKVDGVDATPDINGMTLTYKFTMPDKTKPVTIEYKTVAEVFNKETSKTNGDAKVTATNKAQLYANGEGEVTELVSEASDTQSVSKTFKEWITKEGGAISKNGIMSWTIIVRNNGYSLKDVTVHDIFEQDGETTMLLTDDAGNKTDSVSVDGTETKVETTGARTGDGELWSLNLGTLTGEQKKIITYHTEIKDYAIFKRTNHKALPINKAYVTYTYDFGKGPGKIEGPTVNKSATGAETNAAIEKTFRGYDAKNRILTWTVRANKNKETLHYVEIKETPGEGQSIYSIKDIKVGESPQEVEFSGGEKVKAFTLPNVSDEITFTVETKLDDSEFSFFAGNAEKEYTNTVSLKCDEQDEVTYSAKGKCVSEVLAKQAGKYDFSDHTIKYTLIVNKNETKLHDVHISDVLSDAGLTLASDVMDGDKVLLSKDSLNPENIEISLGDIAEKHVLTFTAKYKDNDNLKNNGEISITNKASLTSTLDSESCSAEASSTTKFNNVAVKKTGEISADKTSASYTIEVNGSLQELPENVYAEDRMGAGLNLDFTSVHLYKGIVKSDGSVEKGEEVEAKKRIGSLGDKTVLRVDLPSGSKDCYLITYDTGVDPSVRDYTNTVLLFGYGMQTENQSEKSFEAKEFAGADLKKSVFIGFHVTDKVTEEGIPKVEFTIKNDEDETIGKVVTNSKGDGKIFNNKIKPHTSYNIEITKVPDGYEDVENQTITTNDPGPGNKAVVNIELEKPSKTINIIKADANDKSKKLKNAVFNLSFKGKDIKNVKEFTTTEKPEEIKKVYCGVDYSLTEKEAPYGYEKLENPVKFNVDSEGNINVIEGSENVTVDGLNIIVLDNAKNTFPVPPVKIITKDGEELEGGKITIVPVKDGKPDKKNEREIPTVKPDKGDPSGDKVPEIKVPKGEYEIYVIPPKGFKNLDDTPEEKIVIKIDEHGTITVKNEDGTWSDEPLDPKKPIEVKDKPDPNAHIGKDGEESFNFQVVEKGTDNKKVLDNGTFKVTKLKDTEGTPLQSVEFGEDKKPVDAKNDTYDYQVIYKVEKDTLPEGYTEFDTVYFKVVGYSDKTVYYSSLDEMKTWKALDGNTIFLPVAKKPSYSPSKGGNTGGGFAPYVNPDVPVIPDAPGFSELVPNNIFNPYMPVVVTQGTTTPSAINPDKPASKSGITNEPDKAHDDKSGKTDSKKKDKSKDKTKEKTKIVSYDEEESDDIIAPKDETKKNKKHKKNNRSDNEISISDENKKADRVAKNSSSEIEIEDPEIPGSHIDDRKKDKTLAKNNDESVYNEESQTPESSLAQTGGFMGTMPAYAASALLILVGGLLLAGDFRKKKRKI